MDTTHLTQKTNAAAPDRLSLGRPHLPWCGRPCCRPWQDAPPDVRPSGQPAAAFHLPSAALRHILRRLDTVCSNSPGTLTLLPDNPPTSLPPRRLESVFTSDLPTATRPSCDEIRPQAAGLHKAYAASPPPQSYTLQRVCTRRWDADHGLQFGQALLLLATSNQPLSIL